MRVINLFKEYTNSGKTALEKFDYWMSYHQDYPEILYKCLKDYQNENIDPKVVALNKVFIYSSLEYQKNEGYFKTFRRIIRSDAKQNSECY